MTKRKFNWLLVLLLAGVLVQLGCSNARDMGNDVSAPGRAVVEDDAGSVDSMIVDDDPIDDDDPGGPASETFDEIADDDPIDDDDVGGPPQDDPR